MQVPRSPLGCRTYSGGRLQEASCSKQKHESSAGSKYLLRTASVALGGNWRRTPESTQNPETISLGRTKTPSTFTLDRRVLIL